MVHFNVFKHIFPGLCMIFALQYFCPKWNNIFIVLGQFFPSHNCCQSHNVSDWLVWWCVWLLLEKVSSMFTEAQCPTYALTCSNTLWLCARLLIWGDSVWWCLEPPPLPSNRLVMLGLWLACVTLTDWKYCLSENAEGTTIHIFQRGNISFRESSSSQFVMSILTAKIKPPKCIILNKQHN